MLFKTTPHQLLRQFEHEYQAHGCSVSDFMARHDSQLSPTLKQEVIAISFELQLRQGVRPDLSAYLNKFPQFSDVLPKRFSETSRQFIDGFCPIENCVGKLPAGFGRFEIKGEIARGGLGVVYDAFEPAGNRRVALKALFLDRDSIRAEGQILKEFNHPNICPFYHVGHVKQTTPTGRIIEIPYMAMAHVLGTALSARKGKPICPQEAVSIVCQIADALETVHRQQIVHFDVTPSNIIVTPSGTAVLIDFGLANRASANGAIEFSGHYSTTYSAPECVYSQFGPPSYQSDIFSLGIVLYELLTGRRPFHGPPKLMLEQMILDPPRRLCDYSPMIDGTLEQICLSAIQVKRAQRTPSMSAFKQSLLNWQSQKRLATTHV